MLAADYIAETVRSLGTRHVFGVGGANIEDVFVAIQRRRPELRAVLGKHEHAAGTAADAYARLTGRLGVVLVTSGGGAMNLVHSVAEARASRVPLLAIVGEPPSELQGRGAFQDTSGRRGALDALAVFRAAAVWANRIGRPEELPVMLELAIRAARTGSGPSVLLIAKDHQRAEVGELAFVPASASDRAPFDVEAVEAAAGLVRRSSRAVVIAGDAVARVSAEAVLADLVRQADARVAVAPDGRDAFPNDDPRFLGVAGAMGHPAVQSALQAADLCMLVGTRLPLLARQGIEPLLRDKPLISVGGEPPFVGSTSDGGHLAGDLTATMVALSGSLERMGRFAGGRSAVVAPDARGERRVPELSPDQVLDSESAFAILDRMMPGGATVVVDAGNTGASAAHYLRAPAGGRWLLAMGMAGMGYSFGAAVGAAFATRRRTVAIAGDGAFFMHGLDVHTAVEHALPITYVVFDNAAHGMCLVRERLLLKEDAGYNAFHRSHVGAGTAAMFPGLRARDCRTVADLERAFRDSLAHEGPSLVSVELRDVEVPPFAAFMDAAGTRPASVDRGANR